jgi:hypothetical protein
VLILTATLVLDIGLHIAFAPAPEYRFPLSRIVTSGLFFPIVIALLLAMYLVLALLFQSIQSRLPGTRFSKGLGFGLAFGGLMLVGSPAMIFLFGSPLIAELRIGLVDGVAICVLGILLGVLTATDGGPRRKSSLAAAFTSVAILSLVFFSLHFLVHLAMPSLFPAHFARPATILPWTLAEGLWIALMNRQLKDAFGRGPSLRQACAFAGSAFGLFSLVNTLFAPVFVTAPTGTLLLNTLVGIICVGAATLAERVVISRMKAA